MWYLLLSFNEIWLNTDRIHTTPSAASRQRLVELAHYEVLALAEVHDADF
jgi:hypothetical protein